MKDSEQPQAVSVRLSGEALGKVAELMPAVALWAKAEFGEEATSPADVVELAIAVLHAQIFEKAIAKAAQERERETAH